MFWLWLYMGFQLLVWISYLTVGAYEDYVTMKGSLMASRRGLNYNGRFNPFWFVFILTAVPFINLLILLAVVATIPGLVRLHLRKGKPHYV
jgi:hypothetical protein